MKHWSLPASQRPAGLHSRSGAAPQTECRGETDSTRRPYRVTALYGVKASEIHGVKARLCGGIINAVMKQSAADAHAVCQIRNVKRQLEPRAGRPGRLTRLGQMNDCFVDFLVLKNFIDVKPDILGNVDPVL